MKRLSFLLVLLFIAGCESPVDVEKAYLEILESERKSAGLTEKFIDVGKFNISYQEGGKGETVLLVHGLTGYKEMWSAFAKDLTPKYHVVAVDLPGHGKTPKIESENYSIRDYVKRLDQFVDAIGLKSFHLAGNSMGGSIAGKYTVNFPGKVLSLALIDTGNIMTAQPSEFIRLFQRGENVFDVTSPEDYERLLSFAFYKIPPFPKPVKEYLMKKTIADNNFNKMLLRELISSSYSMDFDLPKIKTRTFILWGDKDRFCDVSCVGILEKGLSNSKAVIMKECGHMPFMERPEEAAIHYLKFLKER